MTDKRKPETLDDGALDQAQGGATRMQDHGDLTTGGDGSEFKPYEYDARNDDWAKQDYKLDSYAQFSDTPPDKPKK